MSLHHSNLATLAQAVFNYLTAMGVNAAETFQHAGLDPTKIYDTDAR